VPGCRPMTPVAFLENSKCEIGGFVMHSLIRRKALIVTSVVVCLFLYSVLRAEPVRIEQVQRVTDSETCTQAGDREHFP